MSNEELLKRASSFEIFSLPDTSAFNVTVEKRKQDDGNVLWGIYMGGSCFSKSVKWFIYEPMPSSRTKKYLKDTRFTSLDITINVAEQVADVYREAKRKWESAEEKEYLWHYIEKWPKIVIPKE
jgi:hypothetical protein